MRGDTAKGRLCIHRSLWNVVRCCAGGRARSGSRLLLLQPSGVAESSQDTEQDVDGVIDGRMAKDPLGQALQKNAAQTEQDSDGDSPHWLRGSRPEKTCGHLKPAQPEESK